MPISTEGPLHNLTTRLPEPVYQRIAAAARREGNNVSAVARRVLLERFGGPDYQPEPE